MSSCKTLKGGRKKGNGHKMNCGCPICKNMRKSKKHGGAKDDEDPDKDDDDEDPDEDELIENENADESAGFVVKDAVAQDDYEDADEDQNGGKKRKSRKSRKTKRRSSKRKGRKTKRRK